MESDTPSKVNPASVADGEWVSDDIELTWGDVKVLEAAVEHVGGDPRAVRKLLRGDPEFMHIQVLRYDAWRDATMTVDCEEGEVTVPIYVLAALMAPKVE